MNICSYLGSRISAHICEGNATKINKIVQNAVFVPQYIYISYIFKYFHDFRFRNEAMSPIPILPPIAVVRSHLAIYFYLSINPINQIFKQSELTVDSGYSS